MKTKIEAPIEKNEQRQFEITDLSYDGLGVTKIDHYPIFVSDALPGEIVEAVVTKVGQKYGFAKTKKILKKSADRVTVENRQYTQTGIAPLQHLAYPAQLQFKQKQVENVFQKAQLAINVLPTLGMSDPTHYRNKAQIPVRNLNGQATVGFFRKRSHQLVPMTDFFIQDPEIDKAIAALQSIIRRLAIEPYDEIRHTGVLRNIMVRRGYYSHELMLVLVTRSTKLASAKTLIAMIQSEIPEVTSVIQNINPSKGNAILGKTQKVLWGKPVLRDELLGLQFDISPLSFYQVNPQQTQVLYQKAIDVADLQGTETVIDAYSGIGTIGLSMAKHVKAVKGIEVVEDAVKDARHNAKLNGITNAEFTLGKAETVMLTWQAEGLQADVVVVDPPRKGLAPEFIEAVGKVAPEKVVYISCNPATLARDLTLFGAQGYTAKETQPVDMFPMTTHVESVTLLTK
ncbi:23S rRNA (uracil(1939)-C(5))-methyltransferase RlmD [Agrilactobacillus yilanensis]|uniref:23S rRNA (Uracil(1939)-C(5))-methyltransferase RlmD n=1 Tax=Agrilactobacillus yilanensis TaxID=2485997 RepID=A0ABW4JBC2_9LACO|nr:23S rRNA (uracil(1939)-C(5))-methyltransferase RlmD [Agrilactobacillus yilanensis]